MERTFHTAVDVDEGIACLVAHAAEVLAFGGGLDLGLPKDGGEAVLMLTLPAAMEKTDPAAVVPGFDWHEVHGVRVPLAEDQGIKGDEEA